MSVIHRKLILTGARAGKTCVLGRQFRFVEGVMPVHGDEVQVEKISRYIGRCYKAFPEGSEELAHYQRLDGKEMGDGASQVRAGSQPGAAAEVQPHVQSSGGGSAEVPTGDGITAGDATAGPAGSVPGGDGHPDAGNNADAQEQNRLLKVAVESLDRNNDEHWTAEGRPRIDAVETAYGKPGVSRAMVEKVAPGYVRK